MIKLLLIVWAIFAFCSGEESSESDCSCGKTTRTSVSSQICAKAELKLPYDHKNVVIGHIAENMVRIPEGTFMMGTDNPVIQNDGEGPRKSVHLDAFMLDAHEVSNDEYMQFVMATKYKTDSELFGWSFVFESAIPPVIKANITEAVLGAEWWLPVNGAYWKEPEGPGTDVFKTNRGNYPAAHISWTDADKYCRWRHSRLPSEAEWEYAARGTHSSKSYRFPWGNQLTPGGIHRANVFQGDFPTMNSAEDGHEYLSPRGAFPPQNDFGLYDMMGNAWEWVSDWWTPVPRSTEHEHNPLGPATGTEKLKRGGSFLCHRSYCYRYRIVARYHTTPDSATLNSGFRCARNIDDNNHDDTATSTTPQATATALSE